MVQSSLWHLVKDLVELGISQLVEMSEVVMEHNIEVVVLETINDLVLGKYLISDAFLISQGCLEVVAEMHPLLYLYELCSLCQESL